MPQEPSLKNLDEARDAFSLDVSSLPYGVFAAYPTHGFLHQDGDKWIVSDEELEKSEELPSFIRGRQSALAFLRHSYDQLRLGVEIGAAAKEREISNKVAKTLGLASQETVARLQRDFEKLEERLSS